MQNKQEEKMSREEIIYYVDGLIKANKRSYDKRLSPLLYEFFLRANEKFEWSREEFFEKYKNFRYNVEKIKFEKMKGKGGYFSFNQNKKGIFLNKENLKNIKENPASYIIYENIINPLFHECQHATDVLIDDGIVISDGLCEISDGYILIVRDRMINEYANVLSSTIIASDRPLYYDILAISVANNVGYEVNTLPGSIMCAAFDMSEIELTKLKDKGREIFIRYLENKIFTSETVLEAFERSLNTIYNADENNDKENLILGLQNIIDIALIAIESRITKTFLENENTEESLERIYYSIYKIQELLEKIDSEYEIEDGKEIYSGERFDIIEEVKSRVCLYKRFLDNKDLFTNIEKGQIYNSIVHYNKDKKDTDLARELIESKIEQEHSNDEFNIEEIAKKYYLPSNEPLNDNTELISQIKQSFIRPTIKERFKKIIGIEQEEIPILPLAAEILEPLKATEQPNLRDSVRYETSIIHNQSTEKQAEQDISRDDEESTRE